MILVLVLTHEYGIYSFWLSFCRSEVFSIFYSCTLDGLYIDTSRMTTLSADVVVEAVGSVDLSSGVELSEVLVAEQSSVLSYAMGMSLAFEFPMTAEVVAQLEAPCLAFLAEVDAEGMDA